MGMTIDEELKALLVYYGENPNSPEAPKPEDFFGLIASFSSSLQVRLNVESHSLPSSHHIRNVPWKFTTQMSSSNKPCRLFCHLLLNLPSRLNLIIQ
jgi:hypothetical protein